jgi:hypothetical protein
MELTLSTRRGPGQFKIKNQDVTPGFAVNWVKAL